MRAPPAAPPPRCGKRRPRTCRSGSSPAGLAGIGQLHSAGPPRRGGGQLTLPVDGPRRLSHARRLAALPVPIEHSPARTGPHHHLVRPHPPSCLPAAGSGRQALASSQERGQCWAPQASIPAIGLPRAAACLQWSLLLLRCGRHCRHGMPRLFCCSHLVLRMCWSRSGPSIFFCPLTLFFRRRMTKVRLVHERKEDASGI